MPLPPIDGLDALDAATLSQVRARFRELGFGPEVLAAAESVAPGQLDAVSLPLVRWVLRRRGDSAAWLARLFSYGEVLDGEEARKQLGAAVVAALCRAGLLVETSHGVRCPYRLVPLEGLYLLGDEPSAGGDAVMGPGPTTLELLDQLPMECDSPALDVGTGAGTLALVLASRGAPRVVATDLNERAATLTRFNARLNGLEVEVRTGDLGAPVRGERFGWVVSQPSYVFRARGAEEVIFLHGGARGDELAFRLLGEIPDLLAPEGTALVLFDTPTRPGHPLAERVRRCVGDSLDVVLLASPGASAHSQAVAYAALEDPQLGRGYAEAVERNRSHLEELQLVDWSHLLVVLRSHPVRTEGFTAQLPVPVLRQGGPAALVSLLSSLETALLDDAGLLATRLVLHPRVVVSGVLNARDGSWTVGARGGAGAFATTCSLGPEDVQLFRALEDTADLGQALRQLGDGGVDEERRLARVRELVGRGILIVADGSTRER
jgi:SAM-dependent methyltransferase